MKKFDAKKEKIKDSGRKMFAAYGYHKTTLEDIAGLMKLKKNSLYYYFPNKEALFFELVEDEAAIYLENQHKLLAEEIPINEKIVKILHHLIHFIQERTLKYSIRIDSYLEISKFIQKKYPDFQKNQCDLLESHLRRGIEKGEFKEHDPALLSRDINTMITAIFNDYYRLSEAEFLHEINLNAISETVKRLLSYILEGIKK